MKIIQRLALAFTTLGVTTTLWLAPSHSSPASARATALPQSTDGPAAATDLVWAASSSFYEVQFVGGRAARVAVTGNGSADLDLFVRDAFGNELGRDTSTSDYAFVQFTPAREMTVSVEIKNCSSSAMSPFAIMTN